MRVLPLFADSEPDDAPAELVGIARLAAQSETLEAKRQAEYLELETRAFVGRCSGSRMPFVWTVNPYRGCEFGCKYCYARFAHEFMELRDPKQFERKIYVKRFRGEAFRRELDKVKSGESVWIGTATDPYQPAERRFAITRAILDVLNEDSGWTLGITTKSDLITRDTAVLGRLARTSSLHVNLTITTLDEKLARQLEPLAPRPALRMEAVRVLSRAGVRVTVLASPVLPLLTDRVESLEAVCAAAAGAGAYSFRASPVFLKPCARAVFFPFLEQHYPRVVRRYRERFENAAYLKGEYPKTIAGRVRGLVEKYGLAARDEDYEPAERPEPKQRELFPLYNAK